MLHYFCHPCCYYGYVDPISVENRIWGDRNGIIVVMPIVQGFVLGLELLSLACPGLDLGSVMLHYFCHPCCCYGYVDPISVENRIWGDRNGIIVVMPIVQGFVRCDAESLWIVIVPKSKDRFMERPPIKTVQP
jgi:hypothetical protein